MTEKKTVIVFGCAASSTALRQRRLRGFSNSGRTLRLGTLLVRPGRLVVVRLELLQKHREQVLAALRANIVELRVGIRALSLEQATALLDEREIVELSTEESTDETKTTETDETKTESTEETQPAGADTSPAGSEPDETPPPADPEDKVEVVEAADAPPVDPEPEPTKVEDVLDPGPEPEPVVAPPTLPAQWEQLNKPGLVELAKSLGLTVEDSDTRKILIEKIRAR
jgi:hypothetical protein